MPPGATLSRQGETLDPRREPCVCLREDRALQGKVQVLVLGNSPARALRYGSGKINTRGSPWACIPFRSSIPELHPDFGLDWEDDDDTVPRTKFLGLWGTVLTLFSRLRLPSSQGPEHLANVERIMLVRPPEDLVTCGRADADADPLNNDR